MVCGRLLFAVALHAAGSSQDSSTDFSRFLEWLQEGIDEANMSGHCAPLRDTFELRKGSFGNSLFSKRRLEENSSVAVLPLSRLVVGKSEIDVIRMISEERKKWGAGQSTPWENYIALLPEELEQLPKYWNQSFLRYHMKGSFFPDYVEEWREKEDVLKPAWQDAAKIGITWEQFIWGRDIVATRAIGDADEPNARILFPLMDLALHNDNCNVRCNYDNARKMLTAKTTRRILPGDEVTISYYQSDTTTWNALQNWGFVTEKPMRIVRLLISVEEALAACERLHGKGRCAQVTSIIVNNLNESIHTDAATNFLNYLRGLASPLATRPITWDTEIIALRIGQILLEYALARYPQSLAEDELAMKAQNIDQRLRFILIIRSGEKRVLHWWLQVFTRAIANAPQEKSTEVDMRYLEQASVSALERYKKIILKFMKSLQHDALEASQQPIEFSVVTGSIIVGIEVLVWIVSRLTQCPWKGLARHWLVPTVALVAYAAMVAKSQIAMVNHVLKYQMTLAWMVAISAHVVFLLLVGITRWFGRSLT